MEEDLKPKSWRPRALMARAQVALGLKLRFRALWHTTRTAKWSNEGKEEIVAVWASISRIGFRGILYSAYLRITRRVSCRFFKLLQ